MFRCSKTLFVFALFSASTVAIAFENYQGVGRPATPAEVKAWDIDVRPDFKGLPKGSGNVERGNELFEFLGRASERLLPGQRSAFPREQLQAAVIDQQYDGIFLIAETHRCVRIPSGLTESSVVT